MLRKPFKPPSFVKRPSTSEQAPAKARSAEEPAPKRRRISQDADDNDIKITAVHPSVSSSQNTNRPRKPLISIQNMETAVEVAPSSVGPEGYYMVLWRKPSNKKHKTWDGDGVLSVSGGYALLQDVSGKDLGKSTWNKPLLPGSTLSVGGKEVEVDCMISKADFFARKASGGDVQNPAQAQPSKMEPAPKPKPTKAQVKQERLEATQVLPPKMAAPSSKMTTSAFRNPLLASSVLPKSANVSKPTPRHDPNAPGALVMKRPTVVPKGKQIVDVVVDPFLSRHLREHQKEGVRFMYDCVMGMGAHQGEGVILADEMGLGKTLQTIALLWTLLKQNPVYEDGPVVKKALVVCPAGVVKNWRDEFRKWLGNERIGVLAIEPNAKRKPRFTDFTKGKAYNVMIIGYEMFIMNQEELKKGSGVDIVVADEGHRLKTAKNKAVAAIKDLNTERRIILSGTPVQNHLSEYFVMVDLVNPGLLGKYSTFKREFETPIMKSRQRDATVKEKEKGDSKEEEFITLTGQCMLRRTADVLAKYLPPKTEYVLFCKPTVSQVAVYRSIISSPIFGAALDSNEMALQLINILKKACNSPSLLKGKADDERPPDTLLEIVSSLPSAALAPGVSTKIRVLDSLLNRIRTTTTEKVVLVSNYTSTLDIIQRLLTSNSYSFLRLDGSTPSGKRQDLVNKFNRCDATKCFAFLLSAKSGGVGLNLIGASRLILFDVDWNPAIDIQAMARIHRDGQKRHCRIYRLLVQGALDEKIYQRQVTKLGLADAVVDKQASASAFSTQELRDLFSLDETETCQTHTLLGCTCGGSGDLEAPSTESASTPIEMQSDDGDDNESLPELSAVLLKASQINMEEQERLLREREQKRLKAAEKGKMKALMQYRHIDVKKLLNQAPAEDEADEGDSDIAAVVEDELLVDMLKEEEDRISFIFSKTSG